ncbi:hypothetical protein CRV08_06130 [Halarcobacter ebronensis]|uniref:DegT/DnrJ/EryC1/StrS aminotransferase family protein n=1 Tax=Halarcobacter ebronensis TaxID=1462615 RepID=A0A4Q0YES1_9BACT|nr:DegT/DnrJ/EryC1/StrS family aminotransferase [Halarcobacter ebronensis]RXJ69007.1 hypothetical protein CRV08_06130 [Halarcobacter ebronensis]
MKHPFNLQKSGRVELNNLYNNSNIYLYPYARYAFLELLKVLDIKSIYLPSFICRDMLAPINILNLEYYFYEVDEKLQPIIEDIKCDAILMVNYFGFAQKLEPFFEYKKRFESLIIEDNAHGFLSKDSKGEQLGTRTDVGILSIRKTLFLPNGGALLINNETLKIVSFSSAEIGFSFEDVKYEKKLKLKKKIFHKYLGVFILLLRRLIRYLKSGSILPLPDVKSEVELPSNSLLTPLLKEKIVNIDINDETNNRIKMYKQISVWAKKFGITPIYELDNFTIPYEFMFIDRGNAKEFENFLLKKGFFILPWPDLPDEILNKAPEFYKNIKVVPFLW